MKLKLKTSTKLDPVFEATDVNIDIIHDEIIIDMKPADFSKLEARVLAYMEKEKDLPWLLKKQAL